MNVTEEVTIHRPNVSTLLYSAFIMFPMFDVSNVLKANGYTKTFLRNCQKPVTNSSALDEREPATGFAVIPYIQGVTEPIKRILNSHNVKVAQKPFQTLGHIFAKPKDPVTKEQRTDAIYSIPCNDCVNEYIHM